MELIIKEKKPIGEKELLQKVALLPEDIVNIIYEYLREKVKIFLTKKCFKQLF